MKIKRNINPSKTLVLGFAVLILVGATLLSLPAATENGEGLPFLKALFTATSATCVTGLVVVDTGSTFSLFGELVILSLIQVGGLGFMTFASFIFMLLGKRISLKERLVLKEAINLNDFTGIGVLVRRILLFTGVIELSGAFLLAIRFSYDMPIGKAIYYGVFHSISNFNNAGFDLLGGFRSLTPYVDDPVIVLTICALITLGGIGFIVMNDLYEYRKTRKLSLHTKIMLITSISLTLFGTIAIYLLELGNTKTFGPLSPLGQVLGALFQSVTSRTAGANTLPIGDLTHATLLIMMFLMFIGGGSGSTAGGIKVTTFVVLLATVWSQIKGREDIVIFKKRLVKEIVFKAFTVAMCGFAIVAFVTFILSITDKGHHFIMYIFEATSAFGTVGLTMGLTTELSPFGQLLVILTMFAGRLGPLTIGIAITRRRQKETFHRPKGNIMIG